LDDAPADRALLATCLPGGSADAAVPFKEIVSGDPLTAISLGDELSCQVSHAGDARLELFPSAAKPGDCGTLLFAAGTLFAPNFGAHDATSTSGIGASTPFTPAGQTPVAGAGTGASPFTVTTVADAGASGLRITRADSYITGQESYRTDTTVTNLGPAPAGGILYRAGDCYLQSSDTGFGFFDPAVGAVGCSTNPNTRRPPGSSSGIR